MKIVVLPFFLLLSCHTGATNLENLALQTVMQAHSTSHVNAMAAAYNLLQESRLACHFQLKEKIIPTECYHTLQLEQKLKLRSSQESLLLGHQLDQTCKEFAEQGRQQSHTVIPKDEKFLSPSCLRDLKDLARIVDYRKQENPWSGF